jgi:hypothetical protein
LGLKIAISALVFALGVWIAVRGFKGAGDATEIVLGGRRRGWVPFGLNTALAIGGAALSASSLIYWIG